MSARSPSASSLREDSDPLPIRTRPAERRRDLVLDDLHAHPVADRLGAVLERLDPSDVEALGRVELQRPATRLVSGEPNITPTFSRIWLVNTHRVLGADSGCRRACASPGTSSGLGARPLISHLPLELDRGRQRRNRVHGDQIDPCARAIRHVDDLERLLSVVGLGDQQFVDVDADPLRRSGRSRARRRQTAQTPPPGSEPRRSSGDEASSSPKTPGPRSRRSGRADTANPERDVGATQREPRQPQRAHPHPDRPLAELPLDLRQSTLKGSLSLGALDFTSDRPSAKFVLVAHLLTAPCYHAL